MADKIVLITGSYKGIGLETARQLAGKGFLVYITARRIEKAEKTAKQLEREGIQTAFLELDVSDVTSIKKVALNFGESHGYLDVLINNAAVYPDKSDSILEVDPDIMMQTYRTNTVGAVLVIQAFLPYLFRSTSPRIVNVSSGNGSFYEMETRSPAYSVSKTALNAVTKQLALVLKSKNIAVNSVCPGWVKTDMGGPSAPRSVQKGAETIVWLATEAPSRLTGKFLRDKKEIDF